MKPAETPSKRSNPAMRAAILTVSDSVSRGEREDLSGPAVNAFCRGLGWEIASSTHVSDDTAAIQEKLRELTDSGRADVVLTTGGTGMGPRDNTPEATCAIADKIISGIGEEMRRKGLKKTATSVLSRAVAAVRGKVLIVNLPGSPQGAVESLEAVAHLFPHAVHVLRGGNHG